MVRLPSLGGFTTQTLESRLLGFDPVLEAGK
jgi:hypothetical protein